jgi:hypothetical protein
MVDSLKLVPVSVIVCVVEASSVVGANRSERRHRVHDGEPQAVGAGTSPPGGGLTISK